MLNIVEKFLTISGESPIIGKPVYLIRFSNCNLSCSYCDTPNKDEINYTMSTKELFLEIKNKIEEYPDLSILITGGEPLLYNRVKEVAPIIKKLKKTKFYIETNGSIKIEGFNLKNCHYVIDWKAPSSGNEIFILDNLKKMRAKNDCIKFVVSITDLDWLKEKTLFIKKNYPKIKLFASAQQGKIELLDLANFILKNKLPLNLSIQLHKLIWQNQKEGI